VQRTATGKEITVTAENLGVCVPGGDTELLGDVSLTIEPSDMVALMGPSGAGKTTFMCSLNRITKPSQGRVLYRNLDLAENFDLFRTMIGYVPQDDIMHAQLTVYKALYYTAKLRLPADYSDTQIDQRIKEVLASVGLAGEIHKVIGDAVKKTLSGGQRKRVNLAMELLSEPWVLFLDEPTSGLSAVDALQVVKLLKGLSDQGRTVIVTIHQPSLEVYGNFNLLAMISNHPPQKGLPRVPGRLVYFGPAMDAFQFFGTRDARDGAQDPPRPEKIEEKLLQTSVDDWVKRYNGSPFKKIYVGDRKKSVAQASTTSLPSARKDRFRQLNVLCRRLLELKIRDVGQLAIALALPVVFGILVALSEKATSNTKDYGQFMDFGKKIGTAHFLMVVAAMWFGCNNAIREIVGERAIYRRERLVNLSLSSYFASKYVVLGLLALVQCVLMLAIVHPWIGLQADFLQILFTLWATAIAGSGLGLCISSMSRSNEQAIAFLPLALLPMIVLGGSLTTVESMNNNQPLGWLSDIAPTRWAYEADFVLENDARGKAAQFAKADMPEAKMKIMQQKADCEQRQASAAATASPTRPGMKPAQAPESANSPCEFAGPPGYIDMAQLQFPIENDRHTYQQALSRLGILAAFWAVATLLTLKKDEWEWWQTLASHFKLK
jgi:ABC-type multidrug transport system ATPase subunit/ABC-type multidrug transport system permease subunit